MFPSVEGAQEKPSNEIAFISALRGCAILMVVWDHLFAEWPDLAGISFVPTAIVRTYITQPLAIIQDFGFLGVVLFFFVSGYIITHVAQRESRMTFAVKRWFRIYPPFVLSILIIVVLQAANILTLAQSATKDALSWQDILLSMTLLNYLMVPQPIISGVAWTLVVEVVFYLLCLVVLPFLRERPLRATFGLTLVCLVVVLSARQFGDNYFLFAATVAYLPLLLVGQITYYVAARRVSGRQFIVLLAINYFVFVLGLRTIHTDFLPATNSYGVSIVYGYALFVVALLLNDWLRLPRVLGWIAMISYSLYLYHGIVGFALLGALTPQVGIEAALAISVSGVLLIAYLSWRLVEIPAQQMARRLLNLQWRDSR